MTPSGWVNIEELSIGDSIISPNNTIEKVQGVFPQGEVPLELITFQDGRQSICCKDHLWSVWRVSKGNKSNQSVISTRDLKELVNDGGRYMIPLSDEVDTLEEDIPLNPYLVGVILGDGCLRTKHSCTFSSEDSFIAKKIESLGYEVRLWQPKDKCPNYSVTGTRGAFNDLGLGMTTSHTKFIPKCYLNGSIRNRQLLVQGLMDTDGYVSKEGKLYYYSSSIQLAKDFLYLVRSLGAYASLNEKFVKYKGERVKTYSVYFNHKNAKDLVSLPRKLERVREKNTANGLRIESIESFGKGDATCISVTGNNLFIIDDFVVTHNTFSALIDNLQGVHDPEYTSVFFRSTTTEINKGLWLEAKKLYMPLLTNNGRPDGKYLGRAKINEKDHAITFPSGAVTFFSYLERDDHANNHYGIEYAKVYFEECQFRSFYQFNTLLSRNRSLAQVVKGFRATLNPDRNHWVYDFVKRYLDEEGYPIKKLSGKVAYYTIVDGDKLYTSWNKKDLIAKFPESTPQSYTYIPATLDDNKKLMELDPKYKTKLNSLPDIKRKQLLLGCWLDTGDTGLYFKRDWLKTASVIPANATRCRGYDLASSEKTPTTYPDFTVGIGMAKDRENNYYIFGNYVREFRDIDSMTHGLFRKNSGQRDQVMLLQAEHDGKDVGIVIPQDAGGAGKESYTNKVKFFQSYGYRVYKDPAGHTARKGEKAEPFLTACEHGLVYIVRDSFTRETYEWLMSQLEVFNPDKKSDSSYKDDAIDACATAFNHLNNVKTVSVQKLPNINSPTMKQQLGI